MPSVCFSLYMYVSTTFYSLPLCPRCLLYFCLLLYYTFTFAFWFQHWALCIFVFVLGSLGGGVCVLGVEEWRQAVVPGGGSQADFPLAWRRAGSEAGGGHCALVQAGADFCWRAGQWRVACVALVV